MSRSLRTLAGTDVGYCSWHGYGASRSGLLPSTARQRAPRWPTEEHPRGWCREPTVAILEVTQQFAVLCWEAALCAEHLERYAHLDGHVHTEPKQPSKTISIYPLDDYIGLERVGPEPRARKARQWRPRGG